MADNVELTSGSGGSIIAGASLTISGDTAVVQMMSPGALSGSEGSWTYTSFVCGAGAVGTGVQRVTLASDDPAVAKLTTIDTDTGNCATSLATLDNIVAVDDAAFTLGSGSGVPMMAYYGPQEVGVGDCGVVAMTSGGRLYVDTELGQAQATAPSKGVAIQGRTSGEEAYYALIDESGHFQIDVVSCASHAVTMTTLPDTASGDLAAIKTATQLIDNAISGAGFNITQFAGAAVPIGAGTEAAAVRVTLATDSTGVVSIDDGGNTITVDGTVAVTHDALTELAAAIDTQVQCDIVGALPAGTNAIGKLAANSGVDIGDVDVTSISAGTNVIGGVFAANQTDYAYDGTTSCTIQRKSGIAASGTTAILSAVEGKKFRILAFAAFATSATVTNIYLATTTDTDVLGDSSNPIPLATDADGDNTAGFILPWNPGGWTETSTANEALNLVLSAAQDVIYAITYIEVA